MVECEPLVNVGFELSVVPGLCSRCTRIHIFLYGSILIVDAAFVFLIQHSYDTSSTALPPDGEANPSDTEWRHVLVAKRTASNALGGALIFMTFLALLNRPLDRPGTLVVNNRYLRVTPRVLIAVILICAPLHNALKPQSLMAIALSLLWLLTHWEWYSGMERGWKFIEPKNINSNGSEEAVNEGT